MNTISKTLPLLLISIAVVLFLPGTALSDTPSPEFERGRAAANDGDFHTALKIWTALAQAGDPRAEYSIGRLYARGDGVDRDLPLARKWFKKAAEHGLPSAQTALAKTYYFGDGGPQDKKQAIEWFRRAASNGDAEAARSLTRLGVAAEPAGAESGAERTAVVAPRPALPERTSAADSGTAGTRTIPGADSNRAAIGETVQDPVKDPARDTFIIEPPPPAAGELPKTDPFDTGMSSGPAESEAAALPNRGTEEIAGEPGTQEPTSVVSKIGSFMKDSEKYGAKFPAENESSGSGQ